MNKSTVAVAVASRLAAYRAGRLGVKFAAHGNRVSGTVTATQTMPEFEAGYGLGCRLTASVMPFSVGLKWKRFR